jgi:hypothetical protein
MCSLPNQSRRQRRDGILRTKKTSEAYVNVLRDGRLHNTHGGARHLTLEDLEEAVEAAGLTLDWVMRNIQTSACHTGSDSSSSAWSQVDPNGRKR